MCVCDGLWVSHDLAFLHLFIFHGIRRIILITNDFIGFSKYLFYRVINFKLLAMLKSHVLYQYCVSLWFLFTRRTKLDKDLEPNDQLRMDVNSLHREQWGETVQFYIFSVSIDFPLLHLSSVVYGLCWNFLSQLDFTFTYASVFRLIIKSAVS